MNARLSKESVVRIAKRIFGLAGLASLTLVCAGAAWSQSQPAQTQPTAALPVVTAHATSPAADPSGPTPTAKQVAAQSPSAKASASKRRPDGIAVSGWWTIEVRNPDGRVVTHREFENSLTAAGQGVLANVLSNQGNPAGYIVLGSWAVALCNSGGTECYSQTAPISNEFIFDLEQQGSQTANPSTCNGSVSNVTTPFPYLYVCYPTLTMPQPSVLPSNGGVLALSGNIPSSPLTGEVYIDTVETVINECTATAAQPYSASACFATPNTSNLIPQTFTLATVSPVVSVQPNQSVSVMVQFSFSSAAAPAAASVPKAPAIRH
jgi:hypothetical protein